MKTRAREGGGTGESPTVFQEWTDIKTFSYLKTPKKRFGISRGNLYFTHVHYFVYIDFYLLTTIGK